MQGRNPKQEIISQVRIGHIGLTHTLHPLTPCLYSIMTESVKNAKSAGGERFSSVIERIVIRTLHVRGSTTDYVIITGASLNYRIENTARFLW